MRRIISAILLIIAILTASIGVVAYAEPSRPVDIHLVNPVAIATLHDKLYIVDNITTHSSVMLVFDITNGATSYDEVILDSTTIGLRAYGDYIYLLHDDNYSQYNTADLSMTMVDNSIRDIAVYNHGDRDYIFTISQESDIYFGNGNTRMQADSITVQGNTLYSYHEGTISTANIVWDDQYSQVNLDWHDDDTAIDYDHLSTSQDTLLAYSDSHLVKVSIDANGNIVTTPIALPSDADIASVAMQDSNILVLSNNTVIQYIANEEQYTTGYVIGSDTVTLQEPTLDSITHYTLATSNSYPTNIVYKTTNADTSIDALIKPHDQLMLILHYSGSEDARYYYVWLDSGFGWVRKGGSNANNDTTLDIIDTNLSSDVATFRMKLMSANNVNVYHLPSDQYQRDTFAQSVDNPTEVTLLQKVTLGPNNSWYYISYTKDNTPHYGYVQTGAVGKIYSTSTNANIKLDPTTPHLKVNSPLTTDVYIYLDSTLVAGERLVDDSGNDIILSNNTMLDVIERTDNASYINISNTDYYGWVDNQYLIDVNTLSSTMTIGLVCLGCALVLIATTAIILRSRRANKTNQHQIDL